MHLRIHGGRTPRYTVRGVVDEGRYDGGDVWSVVEKLGTGQYQGQSDGGPTQ